MPKESLVRGYLHCSPNVYHVCPSVIMSCCFIQILPVSLEEHYNIHLTFWIFSIFMWILFIWVKFSDPGYIKPNRQAYEDAVKMVSVS